MSLMALFDRRAGTVAWSLPGRIVLALPRAVVFAIASVGCAAVSDVSIISRLNELGWSVHIAINRHRGHIRDHCAS